jgi:L-fucose dehydrogenase
MNLHLDKKIIVVTDGAKGIGEGIVKALAAESAVPIIVGETKLII